MNRTMIPPRGVQNLNMYNRKKNSTFSIDKHTSRIKFKSNIDFINNAPTNTSRSINNTTIRCYLSLTTTPARFYSTDFIDVLKCLSNQTMMAEKIYVSLCSKYIRKFTIFKTDDEMKNRIEFIKQRFPLVEIITVTDRGPATKLLGLLEYNSTTNILLDNDLIIVVDDDVLFSRDLVFSHMMCYQLYNCDVVGVNEATMIRTWHPYTFNRSDTFYRDSYNGFLYGWLSFAITYSAARIKHNIEYFYNEIIAKFPDIVYHDDLLFSLYMNQKNLYAVENKFVTLLHDPNDSTLYKVEPFRINGTKDARTKIDSVEALRNRSLPSGVSRKELEDSVYSYYDIILSESGKSYKSRFIDYQIQKSIPLRSLSLVDGFRLVSAIEDIHVIFTYIDNSNALLTVTVFNESLIGTKTEIVFTINGIAYSVMIEISPKDDSTGLVTKFSHVIHFNDNTLVAKKYANDRSHHIIQTSSSSTITRNKLYSIMTILNMSPEFPYVFFDDNDIFTFVRTNYSNIVADSIENLTPGAYISDVFRYCYLYLNGGIYLDCKKILYIPMSTYIGNVINDASSITLKVSDIFVKDCLSNYSYNAIMICDKLCTIMKVALVYTIYKIVNNIYDKDPLCLTGPGSLGDAIDYIYEKRYPYYYKNIIPVEGKDWLSYVQDRNGQRVIKNTYYGYYDEGMYREIGHYHNIWHSRNVFKKDLSLQYKNVRKITDITLFK